MTPEDQLEFCLQEVAAGRKTVAECAALFPETPDLEIRLGAAQVLRNWSPPELGPQASQIIEQRLHERLRHRARPAQPASWLRRLRSGWLIPALPQARKLALAAGLVAALLVVLLTGGGVVYAPGGALPGDSLYPVKTTVEAVRLAVAPSEAQAVALRLEFADRRLEEVDALLKAGRAASVPQALEQYAAEVEAAATTMAQAPSDAADQHVRSEADAELKAHLVRLSELSQQVPPQAQAALDQAQKASSQALEVFSTTDTPVETPKPKHTREVVRTEPGPAKPTGRPEATTIPESTPLLEPTVAQDKGKPRPTDTDQSTPAASKPTHEAPPKHAPGSNPGKGHSAEPSYTPEPTSTPQP